MIEEKKIVDNKIDISIINSINNKINSIMSLPDLLTSIMDAAKELLCCEGSSLLLSDSETGDLIFNSVVGDKGDIILGAHVPQGKGIAGIAAEKGEAIISNDAKNDPRFFTGIDEKSDFVTKNIICVPMIVMDKLVGVLEIVNALGRTGFDEQDLQKAKYIAEQAAVAITNRKLYDDLTKRIDELSALYKVSQAISMAGKDDNILNNIIESLAKSMDAERASIVIYNEEKNELKIEASYGLPDVISIGYEIDNENSIIGRVFKNNKPMIATDISDEIALPVLADNRDYKSDSFISIPIIYKLKKIGVLSLTDKRSREKFDAFDLRVLSTASSQIAETYQNIQHQKKLEAQRRLAQEIEIASDLQKKILPDIPKNFKNHKLSAYNKPAKFVGGDFYDYFELDENKYAVLVADISGKGIPAALFMGSARNIIRAEKRVDTIPEHLLENANRLIYEDSEYGMFVTLFYAVIDSHNNIINYGSAGHDDQFLVKKSSKEVIKLNANGKPLGIDKDSNFEERIVLYEPGDMLLLFTDGVVECLGGKNLNIELGEEKLSKIAFDYIDKDPLELINHLKSYLKNNTIDKDFRDDFTILAIKF